MPQEPRQKTAATQPFPRGDAVVPQLIEVAPEGYRLVNDGRIFTPFVGSSQTIMLPGIWGGANWPPSAYDPARQRLFVCASSVVNGYTGGGDSNLVPPGNGPGAMYTGGAVTFAPVPRAGIIAALDVTTNKIVWRYRWADQCYSGLLATAGNLVFVGRADGRLTALESTTGEQLWEFQTGAGMHAPVSTFEHNGKQYVIAYSAGSALLGSARGDSVWLFALDGTLPPVNSGAPVSRLAAAAAPPAAPAAAAATVRLADADLTRGKQIYEQACVVCHGADGKSGHGVGAPLNSLKDLAAAIRTVSTGRNSMPPFSATLTPEQVRDVSAYVVGVLAGAR